MIKNKLILIFLITMLLNMNTYLLADTANNKNNIGTTAGQFLNLGIGAKAIAMGNAYIANTHDASSVYWNPAGLGGLKNSSILFMHGLWLEESSYSWMSYAFPTKIGGFGLGVQYVNYGEIKGFDNFGSPTENFIPADKMASLSYGFKIKRLSLGATGKYIESQITKKAQTYSTDIGIKIHITNGLVLAAMARNYYSGELSYKDEKIKDPLPKALEAGLGFQNSLDTFAIEVNVRQDDADKKNLKVGAGFELKAPITKNSNLAIRAGYNSITKEVEGLRGVVAGFGLKINKLSIDYAYKPIGELGDTHTLSLGIELS